VAPTVNGLVELASWSEEHTRVGPVLDALDALRRETRGTVRTSVLTLVVVTAGGEGLERAVAAARELGARHPARTIALAVAPDATPAGLDAAVTILGRADGGPACEEVVLSVRGPVAVHLDSLVEPFTLAAVPVAVWFATTPPGLGDPLLAVADLVLVDARDLGGVSCFATLEALAGERPVVDLSWVRLEPWRELLAGLFEGGGCRPFVSGVFDAEVAGKVGPRHLLAGWLADRLRLPPQRLRLVESDHAALRLRAEAGGREARFSVERLGEERCLRARAEVEGGPNSEVVLPLPPATPGWGLAEAVAGPARDLVYQGALRAALALVTSSV
jgi:glucose-6-phosphate dehydrogenase assembly protein OpcA